MKTGLFISIALCWIFSNHSISQCKLDIEVTGLRYKKAAVLMELNKFDFLDIDPNKHFHPLIRITKLHYV